MQFILEFEEWLEESKAPTFSIQTMGTTDWGNEAYQRLKIGTSIYAYKIESAVLYIFNDKLKKKYQHGAALKYIESMAQSAWKRINNRWFKMKKIGDSWRTTNEPETDQMEIKNL